MKRRKASRFLIGYICFFLAYITLWGMVIGYVNKCLIRYEAAQPEQRIRELAEQIQAQGVGSIFAMNAAPNKFESAEVIESFYAGMTQGKEITWQQDRSNYDVARPAYHICADGEQIGEIVLQERASVPLLFLLTLSDWQICSAELTEAVGQESVTVTAPEDCRVLLNGVEAGAQERTGAERVPEQFRYAKEYVAVPKFVEYQVQGLLAKPKVEIVDRAGNLLEYEETYDQGKMWIKAEQFPATEMDEQLAAQVLENAERYTNFFSTDLAGCYSSTKPIADMFPEDSYYLTLAETYRREDMWMYNEHSSPVFQNEKVENYIRYSEKLFSCEISFDKHMTLVRGNLPKTDTTHMRYFYGLLDGEWKILDMQTLLD